MDTKHTNPAKMHLSRTDMIAAVSAHVPLDGTVDIGVIVDAADPEDTVNDLIEIVLEARADARAEAARESWDR